MEELKTLKDLSARKEYTGDVEIGIIGYSNIVYIKELKAEAVKWIKANLLAIDRPPKDKITDIVAWNYSLAHMNNFIEHFFNLTEEDLK